MARSRDLPKPTRSVARKASAPRFAPVHARASGVTEYLGKDETGAGA